MKKIFFLCIAFAFSTNLANSQCLANYKQALKVCEGTYLKHYELNNNQNHSIDLILNKNTTYIFYLLNSSIDISHYKLSYNSGKWAYPFISFENTEKYTSYILTPEETGLFHITMTVDTNTTACALMALYFKGKTNETKLSNKDCPPGTVQVAENLYMDQNEVRNVDYREYLYWIRKVHGKTSQQYKNALPDTLVWREKLSYNEPMIEYYLRHPAYAEYPLVGVSYEQALAFCQWRSDRVNELLHIFNHNKAFNNGEDIGPPPELFRYRLPSKTEWERYASVGFTNKTKNKLAKLQIPFGNFSPKKGEYLGIADGLKDNASITAPANSYYPNQLGIYNMFGNVAEMVQRKGIAKGGSWKHTESESTLKKDFKYHKPTDWIGFRCVCEKAQTINLEKQFTNFDKNKYVTLYETTNKEYREFLDYLKLKENKELFKTCFPDTTQWEKKYRNYYNQPMSYMYNWHPAYNNYPVVNITQQAMEAYCQWKTDNFILPKSMGSKKAVFRLPTTDEWILFSSPKLGQTLPWYNKEPYITKEKGCGCALANLKIWDYATSSFDYVFDGALHTTFVGKYDPNDLGIYDIIGNVAEVTQEGVLKGGSWANTVEESEITKTQDFQLPHPAVGFRVVIEIIE